MAKAKSPESGDKRKRIDRRLQYRLDRRLRKALARVIEALADISLHDGRADPMTAVLAATVGNLLWPYLQAAESGGEVVADQLQMDEFAAGLFKQVLHSRQAESRQRYVRTILAGFWDDCLSDNPEETK